VRERALELLHEVASLLEQLLGEQAEAEGDGTEAQVKVDPAASSEAVTVGNCPMGGDHDVYTMGEHYYCRKCNKLLAREGPDEHGAT